MTTPKQVAEELTAQGYRRISNRHKIVSRIDNPDWMQELAAFLRCSPAWLLLADGSGDPDPQWCDHYRRCHSKDTRTVPDEVFSLIPGSGHDGTGYVTKPQTQSKEPSMAIPTRPIPPVQAPVEVRLFNALEELTRTMGVTTDQVRTSCNVLDMMFQPKAMDAKAPECRPEA